MDADVIVVGAGLAGLAATAELADAGRRVVLVDQEPECNLGGQAFWSFGGLFLVDSPEQRRMGIRTARTSRCRTGWAAPASTARGPLAAQWAQAYVDFAAGEKRAWLHAMGVRWFPSSGGPSAAATPPTSTATRCRASTSPGGTGPGVVAPFERRVRERGRPRARELRFRHRVDALTTTAGRGRRRERCGARAVERGARRADLARRGREFAPARARRSS
jgi:predicted oxidoreductase